MTMMSCSLSKLSKYLAENITSLNQMSTYEHLLEERRSRAWCFTINNFTEEDVHIITHQIQLAKGGIAEKEHCLDGEGTPHIQGYIYFENARTFEQVKRIIGERAHIEPSKGNPKQNFDYCSKEGHVFVQKDLPTGLSKGNFLEMFEDMTKLSPEEFKEKYPKEWYLRRPQIERIMIDSAMKNVQEYNGILEEKNIWLWGEAGLGKSRWAASNGTYEEIFKKNFNKWWDGYNLLSTKIVIIEDYPCLPQGNALVQHMKVWGDRYPFEAEAKGSHMMVEPRRFFLIVTSNYPIDQCFENEEDKKAIHRRFRERQIQPGDFYAQCLVKLDRKWIE